MNMEKITVDFAQSVGAIKPMNAVNNGPMKPSADPAVLNSSALFQIQGNFGYYREARFPYARTHDAALYQGYGGEHSVDISAIFPDFDADPEDPASYDFTLTDDYVSRTIAAGTQVFFRLGQRIEHNIKKYGILPPKDFKKWAVICEHIIRHMNEGWADGHLFGIRYWEIWNEPDIDPDETPIEGRRCWGGTRAEFFDFYEIAAKHLKCCFPQLMIGGPAVSGKMAWIEAFLCEMQHRGVPLDFFSWHIYAADPWKIIRKCSAIRELMDKYGYTVAESILNEWNYVKGWNAEWVYSAVSINHQKGAAFASAVISSCQYAPVDMLMYYDLRPNTSMNGFFDFYTSEPKPTYYPYCCFADMAELGTAVQTASSSEYLHIMAARRRESEKYALLLTNFEDICGDAEKQGAGARQARLCLRNLKNPGTLKVDLYRLTGDGVRLCRTEYFTSENFDLILELALYEIDYITICAG